MLNVTSDLFPPYPREDWRHHEEAVGKAMRRVMESGQYILGSEVDGFEIEWARYLGARGAVGVANGTDAIGLTLRALSIGEGHKVVIPSFAPSAVAAAVTRTGAEVLLADCDPQTLTMCPASLDAVLKSPAGQRVRAAFVVHLFGHVADWAALSAVAVSHGILLLEDAAQAHGAEWHGRKAGTLGKAAAFSFYPTKNLGALGDAGAIVSNDSALVQQVRLIRQYGWRTRYVSEVEGVNSRLDEMQAAILRVKLSALEASQEKRRVLAARYSERLGSLPEKVMVPEEKAGTRHGWHQYVVRTGRREKLKSFLASKGVPVTAYYPMGIHQQPAYSARSLAPVPLAETERAAAETLALPLHPHLSAAAVDFVCDLVEAF